MSTQVPVLLVTGHEEVREAAKDPRLSVDKRHAGTSGPDGSSMPPELDAHLLNTDPPDHTRLRRLVNSACTARRVAAMRANVQEVADRLLDDMSSRRHADIVADFALPLSMDVICGLLGVPQEHRPDFRSWTNTLLSPAAGSAQQSRAANTASLIATSVLALLTHPVHRAAFQAGDLSTHALTEEALRWNSPAMVSVRRFATERLRVGGITVSAGDRVWLSWASANRDPQRFDRPDVFAPSREETHLAFGHGPHYCPGAALARLENSVAVTSLMRRFPAVSLRCLPGDLRWGVSPRSRAVRELPVVMPRGGVGPTGGAVAVGPGPPGRG